MTAKTEPCDCDARHCKGVRTVRPSTKTDAEPDIAGGNAKAADLLDRVKRTE